MRGVYWGRLWAKGRRPAGFLLCPGDSGGQSVTIRLGRLSARVEVDVWYRKRQRGDGQR